MLPFVAHTCINSQSMNIHLRLSLPQIRVPWRSWSSDGHLTRIKECSNIARKDHVVRTTLSSHCAFLCDAEAIVIKRVTWRMVEVMRWIVSKSRKPNESNVCCDDVTLPRDWLEWPCRLRSCQQRLSTSLIERIVGDSSELRSGHFSSRCVVLSNKKWSVVVLNSCCCWWRTVCPCLESPKS